MHPTLTQAFDEARRADALATAALYRHTAAATAATDAPVPLGPFPLHVLCGLMASLTAATAPTAPPHRTGAAG